MTVSSRVLAYVVKSRKLMSAAGPLADNYSTAAAACRRAIMSDPSSMSHYSAIVRLPSFLSGMCAIAVLHFNNCSRLNRTLHVT